MDSICEWCKNDLKTKKQKRKGVCNKECARLASNILFDDPEKAAKFALKPEGSGLMYLNFTALELPQEKVERVLTALNEIIGASSYNVHVFTAEDIPEDEELTFEQELTELINRHSMENFSGTPDFILARFLTRVLEQFDCALMSRAEWRGESVQLPALQALQHEIKENWSAQQPALKVLQNENKEN